MRQTISLGIASAASIGLAFFFQWYILTWFGPGIETDALFAGMTIPQLVLVFISNSIMHVLVPLLAGESEESLQQNAWGFFILVGVLFSSVAFILYLTAPKWVCWTVPGFTEVGKTLTVELTRIQLLGMVFSALTGVHSAIYHARQQFILAEVVPFFCGLIAFCSLFFVCSRYGIEGVAWVGTIRSTLQVAVMMPVMGSFVKPDLRAVSIKTFWHRIRPLLVGNVYYKTEALVDRFLLSMSGSGALSLYYLGQQFYGALHSIINKAIVAPAVPRMSLLHKSNDRLGLKYEYRRGMIKVLLLSGLLTLLIVFAGKHILDVLVGWGAFQEKNISLLWLVMIGLSGAFIGGVVGQITSTTFYATGNTRTPTNLSMLSYTVFVPIKIMSFIYYGIHGIAATTSIYYLINVFLQIHFLKKSL